MTNQTPNDPQHDKQPPETSDQSALNAEKPATDTDNPDMQQPEKTPESPQAVKAKKRWYRRLWLWFVIILIALVSFLAVLTTTDEGSRRLLEAITRSQNMISYQYSGGNFQEGLVLKNVKVTLAEVDVTVEQAILQIGWRAIVQKELHFRYASLKNIQVIKKTPPSDEPFAFSHLKLPFTLRFDQAFVHGLDIQTAPKSHVKFNQIVLKDALWSGDELSLEDSSLVMPFLSVRDVTGQIKFNKKYPLHVDGQLVLPALDSINAGRIFLAARGDLDTLRAGVAIATPDILSGQVIAHPVRKDVPFQGKLHWKDFNWPVAADQALFSKSGEAQINGNALGVAVLLKTDLAGKSIPYGEYQSSLKTDFKKLDIETFNGALMGGTLESQGSFDWSNQLAWTFSGRLAGLDAKDKSVPESIQPYLPEKINGHLFSNGHLDQTLSHLYAGIKLDSNETWLAGIARAGSIGDGKTPMYIDARWAALNRSLPSIGQLNSPQGRVLLKLDNADLNAGVEMRIAPSEGALLPTGQYNALLAKKNTLIELSQLNYQGLAGELKGTAKVQLPDNKQLLKWQAQLSTAGFDPTQLSAAAPFNKVSGVIHAAGYAEKDRQIITLKDTRLLAQMPPSNGQAGRTVELSGDTNAAILLYPAAKTEPVTNKAQKAATAKPVQAKSTQPSGVKGFAVQFNGDLKTPDVPQGTLQVKVSGTPKLIKIDQFEHQGAAGNISANGQVDLTSGPAWRLQGLLNQFNPGFFVAGYTGQISGQFNTTGHWQEKQKDFQLTGLDLKGILKNQPIIGQGALNVEFNTTEKIGLLPKRFEANNLLLAYAGNKITANGDSKKLLMDINAPALNQIYKGLTGTILGQVSLTGDESKPDAAVNIKINNLGFNSLFNIQQASLTGRLPQLGAQPSQLVLDVQNLRRANHVVQKAQISLKGTQAAHVLQVSGNNKLTNFGIQLAGGLSDGNWLGQVQKGRLVSKRISLIQDRAATLIYQSKDKSVYIDQHCWQGAGSQFCLVEPLQAGPARGLISFKLDNLDIATFQSVMPQGVAWTGKMFGHAKTTWTANSAPTLDAQIYTDNGAIGLAPEDPQDAPLTLPYQRLSLNATTQLDGIKIRFDAKTPGIGAGYIDATINPNVEPKTINGALVLDNVQLSVFKPFFPGMRVLNGVASLAGGISGPLTAPDFYGEFNLKNGQVAMSNLPVNLNRINLNSTIEGMQASINGDFYSGEGHALLKGMATWKGLPKIDLNLSGENLLVRQAPMLTARVTPNIDVQILPTQQQVSINGRVDIPNAVVSMPEASANVIAKSADVRIVRVDENNNRVMKAAKPWAIYADIALQLGNDVYFRGFGSSIPLAGQLNLTQRGRDTSMRGVGAIGVRQNVTIEAYGQRLQLNRGVARFNGNLLQPTIDIDATKSISNRTVGVRVTGRANNPNIAVYNDAGLTEQEALNALLTGRINSATTSAANTAGFKSDVNNTIAAAGLSMGLGGVSSLTNQIGRTVGLNALTVDAEGVGDDTQVSLTGYITPDLFLRYGVGVFTPVNRLTLRYQVNRRLYVEASSALDRAIDMFYNWRF
jgi:translocation and assembly module TamB